VPTRPRSEPPHPDEARLLPRLRRHELEAEQARILARVLAEVEDELRADPRAAAGDPARLRGLPAVGRGIAGAVSGSDPLRSLLAKEGRRRR
jgi:hypothetical protein